MTDCLGKAKVIKTVVIRTLTMTATTTAQIQYSDLPRILPMAQIAMIGPRVTT